MLQQLINALVLGSIYTLFAIGLTLAWGILNVLNLAHGSVLMLGAVATYWVTESQALPLAVVLPGAMLVTGCASVILERLVFRPIQKRAKDASGSELGMLIASIGAAAIPVAAAIEITKNVTVSLPTGVFPVHVYNVGSLRIANIQILIVVIALVLSVTLALFVKRSRHGRALRALAFDPRVCGLLGISANRMAAATMFVSGAIAGGAGVLLAVQLDSVDAQMGEPLLLKAFAIIILGGVGSVGGATVSAYLLAVVETAMVAYVDTNLKDMVAFALIIVLLLLRPQGLFSKGTYQRA